MSTYQILQERVLRRLIDTPTAVQTEVPFLVNEAIRMAQREHNFWAMQKKFTGVTTTGLRTLTPSIYTTDWKEFRGKPFYTSNLGQTREISIAPHMGAANRRWAQTDTGEPRILVQDTVGDDGVTTPLIYPLPDSNSDWPDGEYRITIPYWGYTADLASPSATNWFVLNGQQYIINRATSDGFALDWDEQRAQYWNEQAELAKAKLILLDKKRWLSTFDILAPHGDVYDPQISE